MNKAIGIICIAVSVILFVWGHDLSQSTASQLQKTFTGAQPDKVMHLYIAGTVTGLVGIFLAFLKGK